MKHLVTPTPSPLPPPPPVSTPDSVDTATLALLNSWRIQDATQDPEELRAAEREVAHFMQKMNESRIRAGERSLYP